MRERQLGLSQLMGTLILRRTSREIRARGEMSM